MKNKYLIGIAFFVVVFFMGINYLFIRICNAELPPLWGASLRYLVSAVILAVVLKTRKISLPKGASLKGAVIYGALSYGANSGILYWAMNYTSSSVASVIYATIPLSTMLLANILGFEKLTGKGMISSLLVIAGICLIFESQFSSQSSVLSVIAIVLASILASMSGILIKKYPTSNPLASNTVAMATGSIILLVFSSLAREQIALPQLSHTWLALLWLIISSIIAFGLFIWLITKTSPSKAAYVSVLSPLVTIAAGTILSPEDVTLSLILGSIIVLSGSVLGIKQNNYNLDKK
jgi:drug/metabolite transporter (DMT)-like permease